MPIIEISLKDLSNLAKKKITESEFEKISEFTKIELEKLENDKATIEVKDSNRPDLLSAEGIAREIKGILGKERGIKKYKINPSNYLLKKDSKVKKVRPEIVCAVVKNVSLDDFAIKQIIQLQEKLCEGFGRKRKEAAVGIYDFDKIKWPITYTAYEPHEMAFVPLEMSEELTLAEILQKHEKGKEYAHLLENEKEYPIILDDTKNVLSMPPIINSNYSGKVTEKTKNLFIEVTGFNESRISQTLNIVLSALADRGGDIYSVKVDKKAYPDFSEKTKSVSLDEIREILGIGLNPKEILRLLEKARYSASLKNEKIEVTIPFYRTDIIHPVDIIEDIAIAYGYNKILPQELNIFTEGSVLPETKQANKIAAILSGLEFQEIATLTLSNKEEQFKKMNLPSEEIIEIENPVTQSYTCLRKWLLPSMLNVLSQNTARTYPQKIFETGNAVKPNEKSENKSETMQKLAVAMASNNANFTDIKQVLDYFSKNLEFDYSIKQTVHPSLIEGRSGDIIIDKEKVGFIGEINPKVLSNWKIEVPVSVLEIDLSKI